MVEGFEHLKVTLEDEGRTAVLEFKHGKANEIGSAQLRELERLADMLQEPGGPVALITYSERTTSRGTPIFVAGANVTERVGWTSTQVKDHVRWQRRVLLRIRRSPAFHVVVVGGVAFGWGTEYLLTGDYRIAVPGAKFALPETGLGILPGAGGTSELWSQIGVSQALRLGMTGEVIAPAEAERIGLVQEQAEDLQAGLERARALARLVARRSPTANAAFKAAVLGAQGTPDSVRKEGGARAYEHCVDVGEAAIGREHFAAIRAGDTPPWGERVLQDL